MRRDERRDDEWGFETLVERADLDLADLAESERLLREVEDEPVSPEWVEETVARVTGAARVKRSRWRLLQARRLPLAAAILAMLACTAAVVAVLWSGRDSLREMTLPVAVRVLLEPGQPQADRPSAMFVVFAHVDYGIETLRTLAEDEMADLATLARAALVRIQSCLRAPQPTTEIHTDDGPKLLGAVAMDKTRPPAERLASCTRLARLTEASIAALLKAASTSDLDRQRKVYIKRLLRSASGH